MASCAATPGCAGMPGCERMRGEVWVVERCCKTTAVEEGDYCLDPALESVVVVVVVEVTRKVKKVAGRMSSFLL